MKCTELQELAALAAVGALDRAGEARLVAIAAADDEAGDELRSMREAITAYLAAAVPIRVPQASTRSRILSRIQQTPQLPKPGGAAETLKPGFAVTPAGAGGWRQTAIPGLRVKVLAMNQAEGYRVMLVDLPPGGKLPRHRHTGVEQIYLLSGDLVTEGRHLGPGDFLRAEGGTLHDELVSPEGCVALMVEPVQGPDFNPAPAAATA
jgi:anti-sigma factor ChrR (cupin superfamily)